MRSIDDLTRPLEYVTPLDNTFRKIIRDFVDRRIMPQRREYDEDWEEHKLIGPAIKELVADLGIQRFLWPDDLGGWGFGSSGSTGTMTFALCEEMNRGDAGIGVAVGVTFWPFFLIAMEPHVNRLLCEEFAPMFCKGNEAVYAALLMTEPQGGADIENLDLMKGNTIQTTAVLDGDEWIINGHKLWPTNTGGVADVFGVVCTTKAGSTDERDIAIIFVPADAPGVTQGTPYEKAGMAADKNSDTWLENVRVPATYRACGPGDDAKYLREVLCVGNTGSIGYISGVMLNIYEILQEFVNRKTYRGKPLKEHDAIAGVLADFVTDLEVMRIVGYQAGRMFDRPDLYGERWSAEMVAKSRAYRNFAADRAGESIGKVLNLMETYGADRAWDVEKHWRDIKMCQLWLGGKQLGQMEVARWFFECETL